MSVFQVIAQNLLGFDLIIFVAAALNLACYCLARRNADRLYRKLHMMVFIPSRRRPGAGGGRGRLLRPGSCGGDGVYHRALPLHVGAG